MLSPKPAWLEPLFPWPQHQIAANGRRMAYIDQGNPAGRPSTWGFLSDLGIKNQTDKSVAHLVPILRTPADLSGGIGIVLIVR